MAATPATTRLAAAEHPLDALLDQAAVGIALIDRDGRFAQANDGFARIAGRSSEELARTSLAEIAHPEDWPAVRTSLDELLSGRRSRLGAELRIALPDASFCWVSLVLSPFADDTGRVDRLVAIAQDVTARRLAEDALRHSELRSRRLIEKLPAGAYTCDPEGLITYYNDQAVMLWGREPKLHHPDDRYCGSFKLFSGDGAPIAHEHCWMARALQEGREYRGQEIWIERPDGTRVATLAHASPLRDDAGRVVGSLNILVDVSDRKQAEAMLLGSEERFARFMRYLPGLAWIKDLDGRYLFVNEAAAQAFQKPRAELYGKTDAEVFPAKTSAQFRENDEKALRSGTSLETVETLEHADGVHHSIVSKFPIPGPEGRPALVGGIAIDITARIEAEDALRETEARFRDIADNAPVLIWVNGTSGCEFVNREYLSFLGCSMDDVRGDGWQRFMHPEDAESYVRKYAHRVAERRPFEALFRFRRADGEYRWLRSTGVPRLRADGTLIGYVGCSLDITEIKRSEDALREADRRKDEFLATLAHELRNPLAPIRNSLQVLRGR